MPLREVFWWEGSRSASDLPEIAHLDRLATRQSSSRPKPYTSRWWVLLLILVQSRMQDLTVFFFSPNADSSIFKGKDHGTPAWKVCFSPCHLFDQDRGCWEQHWCQVLRRKGEILIQSEQAGERRGEAKMAEGDEEIWQQQQQPNLKSQSSNPQAQYDLDLIKIK